MGTKSCKERDYNGSKIGQLSDLGPIVAADDMGEKEETYQI